MNTEFFNALDMLEKEKGIPKDYMLQKVEAALQAAYKRESGGAVNVRVLLDPVRKEVKVFEQKNVVAEITDPKTEILLEDAKKLSRKHKLGDVVETELKTKNFGRISAQTAKQVIIQGIREAERMMIVKEYESKREEVVTATVDRVDPENGDAIVTIGSNRAVLRKSEQIPGEYFEPGDMIKVYVVEVITPKWFLVVLRVAPTEMISLWIPNSGAVQGSSPCLGIRSKTLIKVPKGG